ncbi:hypothetical protein V6Z11_A11G300400 [Gossypium hirsutum]
MRAPRLEPRLKDHRFQPQKSHPKLRFRRSGEGFRWPIRTGTEQRTCAGPWREAYGAVLARVRGLYWRVRR